MHTLVNHDLSESSAVTSSSSMWMDMDYACNKTVKSNSTIHVFQDNTEHHSQLSSVSVLFVSAHGCLAWVIQLFSYEKDQLRHLRSI